MTRKNIFGTILTIGALMIISPLYAEDYAKEVFDNIDHQDDLHDFKGDAPDVRNYLKGALITTLERGIKSYQEKAKKNLKLQKHVDILTTLKTRLAGLDPNKDTARFAVAFKSLYEVIDKNALNEELLKNGIMARKILKVYKNPRDDKMGLGW